MHFLLKIYQVIIVLLFLSGHMFTANAQKLEEYNGPYSSWANVKTRFGAKGNGKDDDTKAIQKAIDELSDQSYNISKGKNPYTVVYLPPGTYNISSTLILKGKIGVSIIGENPSNTIIKWVGTDSDTMFWGNGSAYYKISRLTWDVNQHKKMEGIGLHWKNVWNDGKTQSFASLNIEISDNIFNGKFEIAISGGTQAEGTNANDSEITIRRCVFKNCYEGIQIKGYNALDYWIWDCSFLSCGHGIVDYNGNYHAYRCYFSKSGLVDVYQGNGYYTSLRGCFSEDARIFSYDGGYSTNPFKRIFQGNTVLRTDTLPIFYFHWGKVSFWDNYFGKSIDPSVTHFIKTGSWGGGVYQVLSVNNTYGYKSPVMFSAAPNKFYSYRDKFTSPGDPTSASFIKNMDALPATVKRTIIEVPHNADEEVIQQLINSAVKLKGQKPIVHFGTGRYIIKKPIVIPPGLDVQIVGDGLIYASVIEPSANFPDGKAMFIVKGPVSGFALKDIQLGGFSYKLKNVAIEFSNIDQPASQAFVDQLYSNANFSIYARELDYLYIQKDNSFFSAGNFISGGKLMENGTGTARFNFFCSQFARLSVTKNANAVIKDCWWEGRPRKPLDFSGSGKITIDGVMIAPADVDSTTTINVGNFSGNISLLNMYVQGGINIEPGNPSLNVLLWNIHFYYTLNPIKFLKKESTFRMAAMGLTTQCFGEKKCDNLFVAEDRYNKVSSLETFIPDMIADDRAAMPRKYVAQNNGASSIFISRVSLGDFETAVKFVK